jgi:internalin A
VTDAGFAQLESFRFPNLQILSIADAHITDRGMKHLKGLTNLTSLNLQDTRITDSELSQLHGLKKLELLILTGTKATDAGTNALRSATPGLRIEGPTSPTGRLGGGLGFF